MIAEYEEIYTNKDIHHIKLISDSCDVAIHIHDSYEIYLALSDNIRYFIEGNAYNLSQNDIIITNSKEFHRPITMNDSPYIRHFIQFKPFILQNFIYEGYNPLTIFTQRRHGEGNQLKLNAENLHKVMELFEKMEQTKKLELHKSNLMKKSILIELIIVLETIYSKSHINSTNNLDPKIKEIIDDLDLNYTKKRTLDQLSASFYIDKYHMCHLFKQSTGFSVFEYIQSKRIQQAKSLIANHVSISEACHLSGFNDYSNFYKTFKKLTHMSPKSYLDSLLKPT
jgi:AraC-like DNA-binding protein